MTEGILTKMMVVELVICVTGVIANLGVVFVILILRDYKKALTHWYVLQLAIADCAFLLTIPFSFSEYRNGGWIYSNGMCKAKETVLFLNYHASILFLVVMSIDRYVAVCHTHSSVQSKLRTRRISIVVTVTVWAMSLLFCIPIIQYSTTIEQKEHCICGYLFPQQFHSYCAKYITEISVDSCAELLHNELQRKMDVCTNGDNLPLSGDTVVIPDDDIGNDYIEDLPFGNSSGTYDYDGSADYQEESQKGLETCNDDHQGPGWFAYLRFLFVGMFVIPLLIMSYCYICIIRQLRKTRMRPVDALIQEDENTTSVRPQSELSPSARKANKQITRHSLTCVLLVVAFTVCWLPFHAYHLARSTGNGIQQSHEFCDKMLIAVSMLIYTNSALNPLIYYFIGTNSITRLRKAVGKMKSMMVGGSSTSLIRGTIVRYDGNRDNSRNSTQAVTMTEIAAFSTTPSSEPRDGASLNVHLSASDVTASPANASDSRTVTEQLLKST